MPLFTSFLGSWDTENWILYNVQLKKNPAFFTFGFSNDIDIRWEDVFVSLFLSQHSVL